LRDTFPPLRSLDHLSNNLPAQVTTFVGRGEVVSEIKSLIELHRLVTLTGAGGVGKTRCAIQVGAEILDGFDDGVWLVELAPISHGTFVTNAIARALNVEEKVKRPMIDTLLAYLKHKRLLLILDNCEHLIDEARHVAGAVLRDCPEVRILATSRESLNIAGEATYRMPSLAVPPSAPMLITEGTSHYGAAQLFVDRALLNNNRFALTEENAPHVAEICRRLDGIPLAIELAAARVKALSPLQIAQRLNERFRVLTGGDRSALPRHQTMRALIDWSYDLLSDDERALFRKTSIFSGGFTLESATAVCGTETIDEIALLELLTSLVDKSLVHADVAADCTRYRLLESVRQYGCERLKEHDEYANIARVHAAAFLEIAERVDCAFDTTPDRIWEAQVEPEMENWRAALHWTLVERGDTALGQRLAAALPRMWYCFALTEGCKWIGSAIDTIDVTTPEFVIARLEFAQAQLDGTMAHQKSCYEAAARALGRFEKLGERRGMARAQQIAGRALLSLGHLADGEALLHSSLAAAKELGLHKVAAGTLEYLAIARYFADDLGGARSAYTEALTIARETGYERVACDIAGNLAELEFRCGDAVTALQLAEEGLRGWRSFNDTIRMANALGNMAVYLTTLGRSDEARNCAREALRMARDAQHDVGVAIALQHLNAIAAIRASDYDSYARAARLLGYVDMRFTALNILREHTEHQEYEQIVAALREAIAPDALAKLTEEGRRWTADQALAEAMLV
jgi:predicted ATPase